MTTPTLESVAELRAFAEAVLADPKTHLRDLRWFHGAGNPQAIIALCADWELERDARSAAQDLLAARERDDWKAISEADRKELASKLKQQQEQHRGRKRKLWQKGKALEKSQEQIKALVSEIERLKATLPKCYRCAQPLEPGQPTEANYNAPSMRAHEWCVDA